MAQPAVSPVPAIVTSMSPFETLPATLQGILPLNATVTAVTSLFLPNSAFMQYAGFSETTPATLGSARSVPVS